ncbi:CoA-binding protein [Oceanisphaera sp. DM8]|uniref:CoA-binding protein n=2 Tax=Oceanisphaera pacifica TaxID=2818389 RepID=A0ABS3NIP5_9GAMM|nr:CoA-binding protein [Oceanisphaera pacifica]
MDQFELNPLEKQRLARILEQTKRIALVGASNKPERASFEVMQYLLAQGFEVQPVNPQLAGSLILGQVCVASLDKLALPVDLVNVFRRSEFAAQIADEAVAINARSVWLQEEVINADAAASAKAGQLDYIEDICIKKVHQLLTKSASE